jgi:3-dehydroquinate dehydratase-1
MKICTPVREKSQKKVLDALEKLKGKVDIAEVWLDQIKDLKVSELVKKSPVPLLCVVKKKKDKGSFSGSNKEMLELLSEANKAGAAYIDIPFEAVKKYKIQNTKCKLIISHHDFKKTPTLSTLLKKAKAMKESRADIVKIAVHASTLENTFSIISLAQLLEAEKIPHILIAMGEKGKLSRILTPFLGGAMMFAPVSTSKSTASGQLTVKELKYAWSLIG